jgi:hypothetical protein
MTEVSLYEAPHAPDPTGGRLVAWAASLTAAHKIGSALCNTSFVPATFKGKPEEAAAAILFGDEIGLTPTQSLQSVYVISGKPALYARAMVAIVLAAGHEVETVSKSDTEVSVRGRRRGSENWTVETWTKARAQKAGYTSNKKYESDPAAMLYARAASDLCRQIAPDALAGIGYSVEELEIAEPTKVTITRADKPKAKAPEPVEPAFDEVIAEQKATGDIVAEPEIIEAEIVEPTFDDPEPEPLITGPQLAKLNILLTEAGIKDRDEKLQRVSQIVGRQIGSSKELTKAEASKVIEALS